MKRIQAHLVDIVNENAAPGEEADLFLDLKIGEFQASFRVHKSAENMPVIVESSTVDSEGDGKG